MQAAIRSILVRHFGVIGLTWIGLSRTLTRRFGDGCYFWESYLGIYIFGCFFYLLFSSVLIFFLDDPLTHLPSFSPFFLLLFIVNNHPARLIVLPPSISAFEAFL